VTDSVSIQTALLVTAAVVAPLGTAVVFLFKLYASIMKDQLAEMREQRDSFKKGYERAVESLEAEAAKKKQLMGEAVIPVVPQGSPEHNSPTNERQQFASDIESLKARDVAANLILKGVADDTEPGKVEIVKVSPEAAKAIADAAERREAERTNPESHL
jgi:hypothetical protein